MGINVISTISGDSEVEEIAMAHRAKLNIVQCQKSSNYLADKMEKKYGIPSIKVNFFGTENTLTSLMLIAEFFDDPEMTERTKKIIEEEVSAVDEKIRGYKKIIRQNSCTLCRR